MAALVRQHAPVLRRIAAARVGPDLADDVVSDAFERAWRNRAAFDPAFGDERAWLIGIVINESRARGRAERRWQRRQVKGAALAVADAQSPDFASDAVHRVDGARAAGALLKAVNELPETERTVLLLIVHAELSPAEVAQALGLPASTIRSHLNRGRMRIVSQLQKERLS